MAHVLILGSGGREHAVAVTVCRSKRVRLVSASCASFERRDKLRAHGLSLSDWEGIRSWCLSESVDLVVVGPEAPLSEGIVDFLELAGVLVFGPSKLASQVECSKIFCKQLMRAAGIATAAAESFTNHEQAVLHVERAGLPRVIKADGLAAGKGVYICETAEESTRALRLLMKTSRHGGAGRRVLIEEKLEGTEVSCMALTDGETIFMLPACQDHKQLKEGGLGANTGGMGAISPPNVDFDLSELKVHIMQPLLDALRERNIFYKGVLFAGLIITTEGPKVLEFNCRFGDPESQAVLPLIHSDLFTLLDSCCRHSLALAVSEHEGAHFTDEVSIAIVLANEGYPGPPLNNGHSITFGEMDSKSHIFLAGVTKSDNGELITSGGRILSVVCTDVSSQAAQKKAYRIANAIKFHGKTMRNDIGNISRQLTYSSSGVSIEAADELVRRIGPICSDTFIGGCIGQFGMFASAFDLRSSGYHDGILLMGTDGVGSKLQLAVSMSDYSSIGQDLVAMCLNDILCHNGQPLCFLDYLATSSLDVGKSGQVIASIAKACKENNCALVGGETAELPGLYARGQFELAGFVVGAAPRDAVLPRMADIVPGDVLVGVASSGVHSNGFSLVHQVIKRSGLALDAQSPYSSAPETLGMALLRPTRIYVQSVLPVLRTGKVKAAAHITGGGIAGNLCRVLPDDLAASLNAKTWPLPAVFRWLHQVGEVPVSEMERTFNLGLGFLLVVGSHEAPEVVRLLGVSGERAFEVGRVEDRRPGPQVRIHSIDLHLAVSPMDVPTSPPRDEPTSTPRDQPTSPPRDQPTSPPRDEPTSTPRDQPTSPPRDEPTSTPRDEPTSTPRDQPTSAPRDEPISAPRDQPTSAPRDQPTSAPRDHPTSAPRDQPTSAPRDQPTSAPRDHPTSARPRRKRVAVLISGSGTNLEAIIQKAKGPLSPYEVCLVISNKEHAAGLQRAARHRIPTRVIRHGDFHSRSSFEEEIDGQLRSFEAELVCLAGFMRILTANFVKKWRNRLINIHPSLLPAFRGKDAHRQALESGVKITGCTVHFVNEEVDDGEIIDQSAVRVEPGDDVLTLSERIRRLEHEILPRAIEKVARQMP